ncbi:DVU_1553 family AMP-dependent CoA ligase [Sedimentibacter sp.]|uniref:DVU_1553 family AMP-dependent CoA ligase n=1 Tax=Sedimentibacter sp. TaxID=1960295 RepID=UPI0028AC87A0|nr:AMP-binding protein [Sedimentibacter sp.]
MKDIIKRSPVDYWIANRLGIEIKDLTQDKLFNVQLDAFRETVRYVKRESKYYKKLFNNIEPEDIKTEKDIQNIPLTCEQDFAGNEKEFLCVSQREINRVVTVHTTGTTGKQKRIYFSEKDQLSTIEFMRVGFSTMIKVDDVMLVMMSGGTEGSIGRSVEYALDKSGIKTNVYGSIVNVHDAYENLISFKPNIIVGIPHQIGALSTYGQKFDNPEAKYINSALLSADDIPESLRKRISSLWNSKVFNHYGMTEFGIAGGVECEGFSGYHTRDLDLYFEIINEDKNGIGEIVFTTLNREGMPLIRYKTGDIGKFTETECPCGSKLKRIERVYGRKRNIIKLLDGGELHLSEIGNAVFYEDNIIDYECIVRNSELIIEVKIFPQDEADINIILNKLKRIDAIDNALKKGLEIKVISSYITDFPEDGNKKKTVIFQ